MNKQEEILKAIFDDLMANAYATYTHSYHYKETNQIIRKHFNAMQEHTDLQLKAERKRIIKELDKISYNPSEIAKEKDKEKGANMATVSITLIKVKRIVKNIVGKCSKCGIETPSKEIDLCFECINIKPQNHE